MPNQANIAQLGDIKEKLARSKSIILTDNTGLNVGEQVQMRANIKQVGGEMNVAKNTLIRIALQERINDLPQNVLDALNGPTAIIFSYDDAVAATKAIVEYAKTHEQIKIKAGVLAGTDGQADQTLNSDQIKALADLPSRDQLIAQLLGQLNAPIAGFVNVLNANLRGLVQVLDARRQQLEISN